MLAAYDDAMTTQRSLRATHRTIVAEQSEIALKKFQSVKDLGVRPDARLGISRVIPASSANRGEACRRAANESNPPSARTPDDERENESSKDVPTDEPSPRFSTDRPSYRGRTWTATAR